MDQHVDQLDAGGGKNDLDFDEKNTRGDHGSFVIHRSEVAYFNQIFITLFLIAIPLIKLILVQ